MCLSSIGEPNMWYFMKNEISDAQSYISCGEEVPQSAEAVSTDRSS